MTSYTQREHTNSPWWLVLVALLFWMSSSPAATGA
jgi:hypothetical protein